MHDIFFYLFAALTLACGLLVVANPVSRNPVTSAMFLVLTIGSMAGLFVLLNAFFLAAVQILVYAGAVMVLFLFVIMLLNVPQQERMAIRRFSFAAGIVAAGAMAALMVRSLLRAGGSGVVAPELQGKTEVLGTALFSEYLLPFEIVSLLLLSAMVGVVLLSKKDLK